MKKKALLLGIVALTVSCSNNTENTSASTKPGSVIESHSVHGSIKQASFKVWGNCETCKETIEEAAKFKGVTFCDWDTLSKTCIVTFDSRETTIEAIQKAIANAGYDNDGYLGDNKAYADLPTCCQYERKK